MRAISLAIRAFFRVLFDARLRQEVDQLLSGAAAEAPAVAVPATPKPKVSSMPKRSDALTLLATLQRESRLVDFLKEPLTDYSDAQIGAAVRDIHRDCAATLERIFALRPLRTEDEGTEIEVPSGFDAGRFTLTGSLSGQPPYRGVLRHPGWQATRRELPAWTGDDSSALIVTPAEVELR
jgi:hypothetical protein